MKQFILVCGLALAATVVVIPEVQPVSDVNSYKYQILLAVIGVCGVLITMLLGIVGWFIREKLRSVERKLDAALVEFRKDHDLLLQTATKVTDIHRQMCLREVQADIA